MSTWTGPQLSGLTPTKLRQRAMDIRDGNGWTGKDHPLPNTGDSLVRWILANQTGGPKAQADAGKLTYFGNIRSRAEPPQMIAAYKDGVKLEVELIDFEEWGKRKGVISPKLPYITNPDGTILGETTVICKRLATLGGKFILDEKTEKLCEMANSPPIQFADPMYNLPAEMAASFGYPSYEDWKPEAIAAIKDKLVPQLTGPFFAGAEPGYGEAFIWHNLDNCFALCKDEIAAAVGAESMAKLQTFYDRFKDLPGIKEYLSRRTVCGLPGSVGNPSA